MKAYWQYYSDDLEDKMSSFDLKIFLRDLFLCIVHSGSLTAVLTETLADGEFCGKLFERWGQRFKVRCSKPWYFRIRKAMY